MRAYIYTRFSPRPNAKDCDSCEKQKMRCIDFCDQKKWEGGHSLVYQDKDVSGIDIERPAFNIMIKLLTEETHKIFIIIDSPDRLARDLMVGLILRERITRAGGMIVYADGSPSGDSPEDKFIANMMLALATLERDRVSYRTSRGLKKRQAAGEFFGKPPIGYMRPGGKGTVLVPCNSEREAVKIAKRLYRYGRSFLSIRAQIQDECGNFRGGDWKVKTVKKIIKKRHGWEEGEFEIKFIPEETEDVLVDFKTSAHKQESDPEAE